MDTPEPSPALTRREQKKRARVAMIRAEALRELPCTITKLADSLAVGFVDARTVLNDLVVEGLLSQREVILGGRRWFVFDRPGAAPAPEDAAPVVKLTNPARKQPKPRGSVAGPCYRRGFRWNAGVF